MMISEDDLAAIEARAGAASAGPWLPEQTLTDHSMVHWTIHTRDPLPAQPWAPRLIAWMSGLVLDRKPPNEPGPTIRVCETCHATLLHHRRLEVPIDVRWDEETEADAAFIAHARQDVPALVAEIRRLRGRVYEAGQHPDADPDCDYCAGRGERYWHSEDCANDNCVLAGGIADCAGQVEECACIGMKRAAAEGANVPH